MKYALVTGSTRGIGLAVSEKLESCGYHVFRNGRSDNTSGSNFIRADLSTLTGTNKLADSVLAATKSLDCLILNVGATCRKPLKEMGYEDWQTVMDTNVNMPFFLIQRLFDSIAENGSVLFIGSAMGIHPHAASIPYGVSKAAVHSLAQNLVKEFSSRRIRVNSIAPGFVDTEWQMAKSKEIRSNIESKTALGRFATPEEIADAVWAVVNNTYINGAVVTVDGGYSFE